MTRTEFLNELEQRLSVLSECDRKRSLGYFEEMIADRMEEGMTEEEAVDSLETIDEIANRILNESAEPAAEPKAKDFHGCPMWLAIVLAVLAAPIWLPVAVSIVVGLFCLYLVPWSLILGLFSAALGCFFGGLFGAVVSFFVIPTAGIYASMLMLGLSLCCIGVGILLVFPSVIFTRWLILGTKWCWQKLVSLRKEHKKA